ncbi:MAG: 3-oxoacyl-[acyl-carrier protein] reductase, partial [uncultured Blastococcus sp.]
GRPHDPRHVPAGRPGGRRDGGLLRAGRGVRPNAGRGRRRRRARCPPGRAPGRHAAGGGEGRAPGDRRPYRRRRPRGLPGPRGRGDGGVRPGGHPGEQRRDRDGGAGHPGDPRAVPPGDRRQPQRLLLDGPGLRAGDAARQLDREHLQRPGPDDGGPPAGGVRGQQGGTDRADPRPRPAVDRSQGHPRQRPGPGLLHLGDDRPVPRGLPRVAAVPGAGRPQGRSGGARRRARLPGQRRRRVRHRDDHPGRGRDADQL